MSTQILDLKPKNVWKHFYDLTRIPRPTFHVEQVCDFLYDYGKKLNLETKRDDAGNVLIIKPATKGMENKKTIILQGHVDMVPQKNNDKKHDFLKDPIETVVKGDRLYADNTTLGADNGIGVAMIMAVLEDNTIKHPKIEALFTVDEEVGMNGAFGIKPGFLSGSYMINLDTEEEGNICIGCAGGIDANATFEYKDETEIPKDTIAYELALKGLNGGHSGAQIHLGLANANKLMNRFLKVAEKEFDIRISHIKGGSLRNAIPRESVATLLVPKSSSDKFLKSVSEYEQIFIEDFKGIESKISFTAKETDTPKTVIPKDAQFKIINGIEAAPNGVISMLADLPEIVESSLNLALVESTSGKTTIEFLVRSSSEDRKTWICSILDSVFTLAGAKIEFSGSYPGWQPNSNSSLLKSSIEIYEKMFGKKPIVNVIHAGLECGIIMGGSGVSDMETISFGPTIYGAHSPEECVEIPTVQESYDYLVNILENAD